MTDIRFDIVEDPVVDVVTVEGPTGLPGPPGQGVPVFAEVPTGELDSVNNLFHTAHPYQPGTLAAYRNGLREFHITQTSTTTFEFEDAPDPTDLIFVDYVKG